MIINMLKLFHHPTAPGVIRVAWVLIFLVQAGVNLCASSGSLTSQPSQTAGSQAPSDADRLNEEGNQLFVAGKLTAAAQNYRHALQLAPGNAQFHFNLALVLGALGDPKSEKQELERSLQLEPGLAAAHNQLGLLAVQTGRGDEAEKEFRAAIAAKPTYAEALNNLGVLYAREGKDSDAVQAFRQAAEADPKSSSAFVNLALTLVKQAGVDEAKRQLNAWIQHDPNNAGVYMALGVVCTRSGQGRDAMAAFRKAAELEPDSSDAHLNLGMALILQFDRQNGLPELKQAVRLNPQSAAAHLSLGHFYFEDGNQDEARREFLIATRLEPTLEDAYYFWALVERQTNNYRRAADLLQKAVAINPDNANTQFLLGQCLEKLGRTDEAIKHWKEAIRIDPEQSEALYNLARALNRMHDPEAQRYQSRFDELEKRNDVTDRVQLLRSFALEAGKAQNWPRAIEQLQQALELCEACASAALLHKNLAFFYEQTGKFREAIEELQKVLAITPGDEKAQQALSDLRSLPSANP
jgi:tetratricopeptide (TPR) repeat protein